MNGEIAYSERELPVGYRAIGLEVNGHFYEQPCVIARKATIEEYIAYCTETCGPPAPGAMESLKRQHAAGLMHFYEFVTD